MPSRNESVANRSKPDAGAPVTGPANGSMDPAPALVAAMTTEHFVMQTAISTATSEAAARASIYSTRCRDRSWRGAHAPQTRSAAGIEVRIVPVHIEQHGVDGRAQQGCRHLGSYLNRSISTIGPKYEPKAVRRHALP